MKIAVCRFNRLLKAWRVREFLHLTRMRTSRPFALRVATLLLVVVVSIHWNACFYLAISDYIGQGNDQWVYSKSSRVLYTCRGGD